jgi:hypothetical protein
MPRHRAAEVSSAMEARSFSCLHSASFPLTGLESTFLLGRSLHDSIRDTGTNIQKSELRITVNICQQALQHYKRQVISEMKCLMVLQPHNILWEIKRRLKEEGQKKSDSNHINVLDYRCYLLLKFELCCYWGGGGQSDTRTLHTDVVWRHHWRLHLKTSLRLTTKYEISTRMEGFIPVFKRTASKRVLRDSVSISHSPSSCQVTVDTIVRATKRINCTYTVLPTQ